MKKPSRFLVTQLIGVALLSPVMISLVGCDSGPETGTQVAPPQGVEDAAKAHEDFMNKQKSAKK